MKKKYLFWIDSNKIEESNFLLNKHRYEINKLHHFSFSINCAYAIFDNQIVSWIPDSENIYFDALEFLYKDPIEFNNFGTKKILKIFCNDYVMHSISDDGNVYSWGNDRNKTGVLGLGYTYSQATPILNTNFFNKKIVLISLSDKHAAAIDNKKQIFTWGSGSHGELGIDGTTYSNVPQSVQLKQHTFAVKIQCGPTYTAFININGNVVYYGKILSQDSIQLQKGHDGISNSKHVQISNNLYEESSMNNDENVNSINNISNINTEYLNSTTRIISIYGAIVTDLICGPNILAIIDNNGDLYLYNDDENLYRVKLDKKIQSIKFVNFNFYALTQDKKYIYEFISKGYNFSLKNYLENLYSINSNFNSISMIELPYYTQLLFFVGETSPDIKEQIDKCKMKVLSALKTNQVNLSNERTLISDEDNLNISIFKNSVNVSNNNFMRYDSRSGTKNYEQKSLIENISECDKVASVYPSNKSKQKERSNRDKNKEAEKSRISSKSNSRIEKISNMLGHIFEKKINQINSQLSINDTQTLNSFFNGKKRIKLERVRNKSKNPTDTSQEINFLNLKSSYRSTIVGNNRNYKRYSSCNSIKESYIDYDCDDENVKRESDDERFNHGVDLVIKSSNEEFHKQTKINMKPILAIPEYNNRCNRNSPTIKIKSIVSNNQKINCENFSQNDKILDFNSDNFSPQDRQEKYSSSNLLTIDLKTVQLNENEDTISNEKFSPLTERISDKNIFDNGKLKVCIQKDISNLFSKINNSDLLGKSVELKSNLKINQINLSIISNANFNDRIGNSILETSSINNFSTDNKFERVKNKEKMYHRNSNSSDNNLNNNMITPNESKFNSRKGTRKSANSPNFNACNVSNGRTNLTLVDEGKLTGINNTFEPDFNSNDNKRKNQIKFCKGKKKKSNRIDETQKEHVVSSEDDNKSDSDMNSFDSQSFEEGSELNEHISKNRILFNMSSKKFRNSLQNRTKDRYDCSNYDEEKENLALSNYKKVEEPKKMIYLNNSNFYDKNKSPYQKPTKEQTKLIPVDNLNFDDLEKSNIYKNELLEVKNKKSEEEISNIDDKSSIINQNLDFSNFDINNKSPINYHKDTKEQTVSLNYDNPYNHVNFNEKKEEWIRHNNFNNTYYEDKEKFPLTNQKKTQEISNSKSNDISNLHNKDESPRRNKEKLQQKIETIKLDSANFDNKDKSPIFNKKKIQETTKTNQIHISNIEEKEKPSIINVRKGVEPSKIGHKNEQEHTYVNQNDDPTLVYRDTSPIKEEQNKNNYHDISGTDNKNELPKNNNNNNNNKIGQQEQKKANSIKNKKVEHNNTIYNQTKVEEPTSVDISEFDEKKETPLKNQTKMGESTILQNINISYSDNLDKTLLNNKFNGQESTISKNIDNSSFYNKDIKIINGKNHPESMKSEIIHISNLNDLDKYQLIKETRVHEITNNNQPKLKESAKLKNTDTTKLDNKDKSQEKTKSKVNEPNKSKHVDKSNFDDKEKCPLNTQPKKEGQSKLKNTDNSNFDEEMNKNQVNKTIKGQEITQSKNINILNDDHEISPNKQSRVQELTKIKNMGNSYFDEKDKSPLNNAKVSQLTTSDNINNSHLNDKDKPPLNNGVELQEQTKSENNENPNIENKNKSQLKTQSKVKESNKSENMDISNFDDKDKYPVNNQSKVEKSEKSENIGTNSYPMNNQSKAKKLGESENMDIYNFDNKDKYPSDQLKKVQELINSENMDILNFDQKDKYPSSNSAILQSENMDIFNFNDKDNYHSNKPTRVQELTKYNNMDISNFDDKDIYPIKPTGIKEVIKSENKGNTNFDSMGKSPSINESSVQDQIKSEIIRNDKGESSLNNESRIQVQSKSENISNFDDKDKSPFNNKSKVQEQIKLENITKINHKDKSPLIMNELKVQEPTKSNIISHKENKVEYPLNNEPIVQESENSLYIYDKGKFLLNNQSKLQESNKSGNISNIDDKVKSPLNKKSKLQEPTNSEINSRIDVQEKSPLINKSKLQEPTKSDNILSVDGKDNSQLNNKSKLQEPSKSKIKDILKFDKEKKSPLNNQLKVREPTKSENIVISNNNYKILPHQFKNVQEELKTNIVHNSNSEEKNKPFEIEDKPSKTNNINILDIPQIEKLPMPDKTFQENETNKENISNFNNVKSRNNETQRQELIKSNILYISNSENDKSYINEKNNEKEPTASKRIDNENEIKDNSIVNNFSNFEEDDKSLREKQKQLQNPKKTKDRSIINDKEEMFNHNEDNSSIKINKDLINDQSKAKNYTNVNKHNNSFNLKALELTKTNSFHSSNQNQVEIITTNNRNIFHDNKLSNHQNKDSLTINHQNNSPDCKDTINLDVLNFDDKIISPLNNQKNAQEPHKLTLDFSKLQNNNEYNSSKMKFISIYNNKESNNQDHEYYENNTPNNKEKKENMAAVHSNTISLLYDVEEHFKINSNNTTVNNENIIQNTNNEPTNTTIPLIYKKNKRRDTNPAIHFKINSLDSKSGKQDKDSKKKETLNTNNTNESIELDFVEVKEKITNREIKNEDDVYNGSFLSKKNKPHSTRIFNRGNYASDSDKNIINLQQENNVLSSNKQADKNQNPFFLQSTTQKLDHKPINKSKTNVSTIKNDHKKSNSEFLVKSNDHDTNSNNNTPNFSSKNTPNIIKITPKYNNNIEKPTIIDDKGVIKSDKSSINTKLTSSSSVYNKDGTIADHKADWKEQNEPNRSDNFNVTDKLQSDNIAIHNSENCVNPYRRANARINSKSNKQHNPNRTLKETDNINNLNSIQPNDTLTNTNSINSNNIHFSNDNNKMSPIDQSEEKINILLNKFESTNKNSNIPNTENVQYVGNIRIRHENSNFVNDDLSFKPQIFNYQSLAVNSPSNIENISSNIAPMDNDEYCNKEPTSKRNEANANNSSKDFNIKTNDVSSKQNSSYDRLKNSQSDMLEDASNQMNNFNDSYKKIDLNSNRITITNNNFKVEKAIEEINEKVNESKDISIEADQINPHLNTPTNTLNKKTAKGTLKDTNSLLDINDKSPSLIEVVNNSKTITEFKNMDIKSHDDGAMNITATINELKVDRNTLLTEKFISPKRSKNNPDSNYNDSNQEKNSITIPLVFPNQKSIETNIISHEVNKSSIKEGENSNHEQNILNNDIEGIESSRQGIDQLKGNNKINEKLCQQYEKDINNYYKKDFTIHNKTYIQSQFENLNPSVDMQINEIQNIHNKAEIMNKEQNCSDIKFNNRRLDENQSPKNNNNSGIFEMNSGSPIKSKNYQKPFKITTKKKANKSLFNSKNNLKIDNQVNRDELANTSYDKLNSLQYNFEVNRSSKTNHNNLINDKEDSTFFNCNENPLPIFHTNDNNLRQEVTTITIKELNNKINCEVEQIKDKAKLNSRKDKRNLKIVDTIRSLSGNIEIENSITSTLNHHYPNSFNQSNLNNTSIEANRYVETEIRNSDKFTNIVDINKNVEVKSKDEDFNKAMEKENKCDITKQQKQLLHNSLIEINNINSSIKNIVTNNNTNQATHKSQNYHNISCVNFSSSANKIKENVDDLFNNNDELIQINKVEGDHIPLITENDSKRDDNYLNTQDILITDENIEQSICQKKYNEDIFDEKSITNEKIHKFNTRNNHNFQFNRQLYNNSDAVTNNLQNEQVKANFEFSHQIETGSLDKNETTNTKLTSPLDKYENNNNFIAQNNKNQQLIRDTIISPNYKNRDDDNLFNQVNNSQSQIKQENEVNFNKEMPINQYSGNKINKTNESFESQEIKENKNYSSFQTRYNSKIVDKYDKEPKSNIEGSENENHPSENQLKLDINNSESVKINNLDKKDIHKDCNVDDITNSSGVSRQLQQITNKPRYLRNSNLINTYGDLDNNIYVEDEVRKTESNNYNLHENKSNNNPNFKYEKIDKLINKSINEINTISPIVHNNKELYLEEISKSRSNKKENVLNNLNTLHDPNNKLTCNNQIENQEKEHYRSSKEREYLFNNTMKEGEVMQNMNKDTNQKVYSSNKKTKKSGEISPTSIPNFGHQKTNNEILSNINKLASDKSCIQTNNNDTNIDINIRSSSLHNDSSKIFKIKEINPEEYNTNNGKKYDLNHNLNKDQLPLINLLGEDQSSLSYRNNLPLDTNNEIKLSTKIDKIENNSASNTINNQLNQKILKGLTGTPPLLSAKMMMLNDPFNNEKDSALSNEANVELNEAKVKVSNIEADNNNSEQTIVKENQPKYNLKDNHNQASINRLQENNPHKQNMIVSETQKTTLNKLDNNQNLPKNIVINTNLIPEEIKFSSSKNSFQKEIKGVKIDENILKKQNISNYLLNKNESRNITSRKPNESNQHLIRNIPPDVSQKLSNSHDNIVKVINIGPEDNFNIEEDDFVYYYITDIDNLTEITEVDEPNESEANSYRQKPVKYYKENIGINLKKEILRNVKEAKGNIQNYESEPSLVQSKFLPHNKISSMNKNDNEEINQESTSPSSKNLKNSHSYVDIKNFKNSKKRDNLKRLTIPSSKRNTNIDKYNSINTSNNTIEPNHKKNSKLDNFSDKNSDNHKDICLNQSIKRDSKEQNYTSGNMKLKSEDSGSIDKSVSFNNIVKKKNETESNFEASDYIKNTKKIDLENILEEEEDSLTNKSKNVTSNILNNEDQVDLSKNCELNVSNTKQETTDKFDNSEPLVEDTNVNNNLNKDSLNFSPSRSRSSSQVFEKSDNKERIKLLTERIETLKRMKSLNLENNNKIIHETNSELKELLEFDKDSEFRRDINSNRNLNSEFQTFSSKDDNDDNMTNSSSKLNNLKNTIINENLIKSQESNSPYFKNNEIYLNEPYNENDYFTFKSSSTIDKEEMENKSALKERESRRNKIINSNFIRIEDNSEEYNNQFNSMTTGPFYRGLTTNENIRCSEEYSPSNISYKKPQEMVKKIAGKFLSPVKIPPPNYKNNKNSGLKNLLSSGKNNMKQDGPVILNKNRKADHISDTLSQTGNIKNEHQQPQIISHNNINTTITKSNNHQTDQNQNISKIGNNITNLSRSNNFQNTDINMNTPNQEIDSIYIDTSPNNKKIVKSNTHKILNVKKNNTKQNFLNAVNRENNLGSITYQRNKIDAKGNMELHFASDNESNENPAQRTKDKVNRIEIKNTTTSAIKVSINSLKKNVFSNPDFKNKKNSIISKVKNKNVIRNKPDQNTNNLNSNANISKNLNNKFFSYSNNCDENYNLDQNYIEASNPFQVEERGNIVNNEENIHQINKKLNSLSPIKKNNQKLINKTSKNIASTTAPNTNANANNNKNKMVNSSSARKKSVAMPNKEKEKFTQVNMKVTKSLGHFKKQHKIEKEMYNSIESNPIRNSINGTFNSNLDVDTKVKKFLKNNQDPTNKNNKNKSKRNLIKEKDFSLKKNLLFSIDYWKDFCDRYAKSKQNIKQFIKKNILKGDQDGLINSERIREGENITISNNSNKYNITESMDSSFSLDDDTSIINEDEIPYDNPEDMRNYIIRNLENFKFGDVKEKLEKFLRRIMQAGNVSPKDSLCLTPVKLEDQDDNKENTSEFEPLELDRSQLTTKSVNVSYRNKSVTNLPDLSASYSSHRLVTTSDVINSSNMQRTISNNENLDSRFTKNNSGTRVYNLSLTKDSVSSKLNQIVENIIEEKESPPMKLRYHRVNNISGFELNQNENKGMINAKQVKDLLD